jgi:DNA replication protein DnaC
MGRSVEHFNHAAIPARHADSTLVSFDKDLEGVTESFIRAFSWTESFDPGRENRGLVLHGQVGRGKTHLMVAMIRELTLRKGTAVRFIEVTELLSQLREAFSERRSTSSLLHSVSNVPVLAIDELGKGGRTDWQMSVIDEVISRRYNTMGTILATTNYPPGPPTGAGSVNLADEASLQRQTLGDRIGARAYSRLREVCDFVEIRGADYRERPRNG